MSERRGFASDNHAGVHPEVIEAIAAANDGHAEAYGGDPCVDLSCAAALPRALRTDRAGVPSVQRDGGECAFVEALAHPWQAVVCARTAHLSVDECGAPERAGRKLLTLDTPDGRLTPELVAPLLAPASATSTSSSRG